MGELLEIKSGVWCRQRWCRADPAADHHDGDGCSCHPQTHAAPGANDSGATAAEPRADESQLELWGVETEAASGRAGPGLGAPTDAAAPRLTVLTAKASRLRAFACRACGRNTRRMVEAPEMFFRCEDCARADRWPPSRRQA